MGLGPQAFMRVLRFRKAVHEIEKRTAINWATVALDCGYYEQAHFIEEFKTFSGFTPVQYLNSKNENLNWVPLR